MAIAVTGAGAITALGGTLATTWDALVAGSTGIRRISRFDADAYPAHVGAEVHDTGASGGQARDWRLGTQCFHAAAAEALAGARLPETLLARTACLAGLSVNYVHHGFLREVWKAERRSRAGLDEAIGAALDADGRVARRRDGGWQLNDVARTLRLGGPRALIDTACASSLHALVEAVRWLRLGLADAVVVGGGCALVNPLSVVAFGRIGALSPSRDPLAAARPFDRRRDGFVLGEGGAAIVLEREAAARARGAEVLARVTGCATSTNASSMTDPSPGGRGEAAAMRAAVTDAGLAPQDVDLVLAHGTATPKNDSTELLALLAVLGARARAIPIVSVKGALGHTLSAAGMLNVVTAIRSLQTSIVPPTCGWDEPDGDRPFDHVRAARATGARTALVNAFAFGGLNAVAVIEGGA